MRNARIKLFAMCLESREKTDIQRGWTSGEPGLRMDDLMKEEMNTEEGEDF